MSKRVPQSKRLQLINKWLRGIEDEDFEVFPTKTEGKYIVRPRKEPLAKSPAEKPNEPPAEPPIEPQAEEPTVEQPEEPPVKPLPKKITRTKSQAPQSNNPIYSRSEVGFANDPTINIEILNQLKLLGEEFKNERAKKEQKKMIKEVVQKQMNKQPRQFYQYTQPQYIQEPNDINDEEPEEPLAKQGSAMQPISVAPPQPIRRRRNNIFSDMC